MNRLWLPCCLRRCRLAGTGLAAGANAVDISGAEIDKALQRTATDPESDQALRVVNIENQFNLGISIVHRARTSNRPIDPATALEISPRFFTLFQEQAHLSPAALC